MELLKTVTGKVVSGAVALAVVAAGISWWRMDEATRQTLLGGTGKIVAWLGIVLVVPWVTFFVIGRVARAESNLAGAVIVYANTRTAPAKLLSARATRPITKNVTHGTTSTIPSHATIFPVPPSSVWRVASSIRHHEIPAATTASATA